MLELIEPDCVLLAPEFMEFELVPDVEEEAPVVPDVAARLLSVELLAPVDEPVVPVVPVDEPVLPVVPELLGEDMPEVRSVVFALVPVPVVELPVPALEEVAE